MIENPSGRAHWFEGDGMVHAFRIKNGRLWYCNRFTKTQQYLKTKEAGKREKVMIGELWGYGCLLVPISMLQAFVGYTEPPSPRLEANSANTAFIHHSKRTYALVEVDLPFRIKVDLNDDILDIQSLGFDDYEGWLRHNCTAHPKVD